MVALNKYKIDLHVHTPSSKDYKGEKNEREYFEIIKNAYENRINAICITDHFSVNGFNTVNKLKEKTSLFLKSINEREQKESISHFKNKIEEEMSVLNSVHILMGIEVNVAPGVHYIIVFHEIVKPEQVEDFLLDMDQDISNNYGAEDYILKINSLQLFERIKSNFGDKCFLYAPHCDSDSGLIEAYKNFKGERLEILKNDALLCVSFNKDKTRAYIKENLCPHFYSSRTQPLNNSGSSSIPFVNLFAMETTYFGGYSL